MTGKFGSIQKPLVGKTFGFLTVLEDIPRSDECLVRRERCRCVCGEEVVVRYSTLLSTPDLSCGCKNPRHKVLCFTASMYSPRGINRPAVGKVFGRLTVLEDIPPGNGHRFRMARCKCTCGNECTVVYQSLRQGHTLSCGCLHAEVLSNMVRDKWRLIHNNNAARQAEDREVYADLYRDVMHGITSGTLSFDEFCRLLEEAQRRNAPAPKPHPHIKADYGKYVPPEAIGEFYESWAAGDISISEVARNLGVLPHTCRVYMFMYENRLLFDEIKRIRNEKDAVDTEANPEEE